MKKTEVTITKEDETRRQIRHKYYSSKTWRILRPLKISQSPLCEDCLKEGIVEPATQVHHIVSPFKYNDDRRDLLFADYGNLVSLCAKCHEKRHGHGISMEDKIKKYYD